MAKAASQALKAILDAAATGQFPAPDGRMTILAQLSARDAGVIAFAGHSVIFADADPTWVVGQLPAGDLAAPLSPPFLHALAQRTGRVAHATDMLTCAAARPAEPDIELIPEPDHDHPRIARALGYRDDVQAWRAPGGVLLIGRGVAGRWEVALEVDDEHRGRGLGRALALAARHLVPGGAPLWAQIAPGNAGSVRAFLAAGFQPVGAEALLTTA
jgi:GNAT superfamily N-acetyltransferase